MMGRCRFFRVASGGDAVTSSCWRAKITAVILVYSFLTAAAAAAEATLDDWSATTAVVFGTDHGYDRGGPDPVCWRSTFYYSSNANGNNNSTNDGSSEPLVIVGSSSSSTAAAAWNQMLWDSLLSAKQDDADADHNDNNDGDGGTATTAAPHSTIELLRRCNPGTQLLVDFDTDDDVTRSSTNNKRSDEEQQATIFTDTVTTFTIRLSWWQSATMNASTISSSSSSSAPATRPAAAVAFVRLQLCNAWRFGFCNPMAQLMMDNSNDDVETNGIVVSTWTAVQWFENHSNDDEEEGTLWHGRASLSLFLPANTTRPGPYHVVAHAFFVEAGDVNNSSSSSNQTMFFARSDLAAPIPGHVVVMVRDPPTLLQVTRTTKIVMGTAMGICGAFALFVCVFCCVRRHHPAMRLAQGNFLTAMSIGCLLQIVGSCAMFPTRDVYCRTFGILGLLPMTFVAACLVGRIWRVYRTLASVHRLGRHNHRPSGHHQRPQQQQEEDLMLKRRQSLANATGDTVVSALTSIANLPNNMSPFASPDQNERQRRWQRGGGSGGGGRGDTARRRPNHRQSSSTQGGPRQSVTARETATLVVALTLPQLLLQVLAATLDDRQLVLHTDASGTFQRLACTRDGRWASMVGTVYVALLCMLAVGLAWVSRDLPSAFNEKDQVYRAASVCIFFTFIGIAVWNHLNDPATHPDLAVRVVSLVLNSTPWLNHGVVFVSFSLFRSFY
jgi:hypothetical protein